MEGLSLIAAPIHPYCDWQYDHDYNMIQFKKLYDTFHHVDTISVSSTRSLPYYMWVSQYQGQRAKVDQFTQFALGSLQLVHISLTLQHCFQCLFVGIKEKSTILRSWQLQLFLIFTWFLVSSFTLLLLNVGLQPKSGFPRPSQPVSIAAELHHTYFISGFS